MHATNSPAIHTGNQGGAILSEYDTETVQVGHGDTQEFLLVVDVPDADVIIGRRGKEIRATIREADIVHLGEMASAG